MVQEASVPPSDTFVPAPVPPPAAIPVPAVNGTSQLAGAPTPDLAEALPTGLFQWGPVQLHPHARYRFSYGNGLQASPGQQANTAINELAPGILFNLGQHWQLDYTPTLRFYSSSRFRDTTDQSVVLTGATSYQDWDLGLSQSYVSSSAPLVETASQTDTQNYATGLNATYHFSSSLALESALSQNFRFVGQGAPGEQLTDSRSWSLSEWLNYRIAPRLTGAIGTVLGYDNLQVGSDMTSEQLQGRLSWGVGEKLTLSANAGFEDRQFLDSQSPNALNPIFGFSALYQLFATTALSLNASRTVGVSFFQNQITETTSVTAGLQQRLLGKLNMGVIGGYSLSSYQASTTALAVNRQDNRYNVGVRLSCPFLKRGTAAIFYDWSHNVSNESGFQYSSNQAGLELAYRF